MVLETENNAINVMGVGDIFQEEIILILQQFGMNIQMVNKPTNSCQKYLEFISVILIPNWYYIAFV